MFDSMRRTHAWQTCGHIWKRVRTQTITSWGHMLNSMRIHAWGHKPLLFLQCHLHTVVCRQDTQIKQSPLPSTSLQHGPNIVVFTVDFLIKQLYDIVDNVKHDLSCVCVDVEAFLIHDLRDLSPYQLPPLSCYHSFLTTSGMRPSSHEYWWLIFFCYNLWGIRGTYIR